MNVSAPRSAQWLLAAATALTFAAALVRYDGPARGYWDTYITAPAMFMNKSPVRFVLADGSKAFRCELQGKLPDDLKQDDDFGIITKDQRIGPAIAAAPMFTAFGLLGFRLLYALTVALIVPLAWMLCLRAWTLQQNGLVPAQRTERAPPCNAALAGAVLLANNPFSWAVDRLNANLFVMPMMLLCLWLLLDWRRHWVLLGVVFGAMAGIRNEAICFVPAICLALLADVRVDSRDHPIAFRWRFNRLVGVGALTVVMMLPVFYWKWWALGHPLMHPSQYAHFQGFRPEFAHSLFGWHFTFNGLFNWPLHTELVRTPHFGYPTWLLFPLVTALAWGTVCYGLMVWGCFVCGRSAPGLMAVLFVWSLPVYALFGPQENWEEVKMTFMLLAWPPIAPLFAIGAADIFRAAREIRWVPLVACALVTFGGVQLLAQVQAPQDMRWYVRFPNADKAKNPGAQRGLAERDRNEWRYFQSYETDEEIAEQRAKLSAGLPWPARYLPTRFDVAAAIKRMGEEAGNRELKVLEIWGYIYGTRRWPAGGAPPG